MAYNKKNYYKTIVKIQDITQMQYHQFGLSYKQIFHLFIEEQFNVSIRTYRTYLGVPAKRELKKLEAADQKETNKIKRARTN